MKHNGQKKKDKQPSAKKLHRKLKIEQHEPQVNSKKRKKEITIKFKISFGKKHKNEVNKGI